MSIKIILLLSTLFPILLICIVARKCEATVLSYGTGCTFSLHKLLWYGASNFYVSNCKNAI